MKLVSIIIPTYQHARYLERAINSVLNQTYSEVEIIIVDDGSSDSTSAVLRKYDSYSNIIIIRQKNKGLPAARNIGLENSNGEYVTFLDADDYFYPDKIIKQVDILDKDDSVGFVYCSIHVLDENECRIEHNLDEKIGSLSGNIFSRLLRGGYFPPHTVLLRKNLLDEYGGFNEKLGGHADYELWLRLSGHGCKSFYINEPLAFYQTGEANMSKNWRHMCESREETLKLIVNKFPDATASVISKIHDDNEDLRRINDYLSEKLVKENINSALFYRKITFIPGPKKISRLIKEFKNRTN